MCTAGDSGFTSVTITSPLVLGRINARWKPRTNATRREAAVMRTLSRATVPPAIPLPLGLFDPFSAAHGGARPIARVHLARLLRRVRARPGPIRAAPFRAQVGVRKCLPRRDRPLQAHANQVAVLCGREAGRRP